MGMSTYVVGFVPPDETYEQMAEVWRACATAGVSVPDEVARFFEQSNEGMGPDGSGFEVKIPHHEYLAPSAAGFEVRLDEVPENVKVIRFYNSW